MGHEMGLTHVRRVLLEKMTEYVLWKNVLESGQLPDDIRHYLTLEFIVPFVIAKREAERIEPFYKKIDCIGDLTEDENGRIILDNEVFDYNGVQELLLDDSIVLDKRIEDGRRVKYIDVLERFIQTPILVFDKRACIMKGLEWDSFNIFLECVTSITLAYCPGVADYLERLVVRIQGNLIFKDRIKPYLEHYGRSFILIALLACSENALVCFLSFVECDMEFKTSYNIPSNQHKEMRQLYEKYREQLDKHFIFVFHE